MAKNALLAAILSFFIPGLGQMYAGRLIRGIIVLVITLVFFGVAWRVSLFVGIIPFIFWVWNIVDAYYIASKNTTFLIPDFIK